VNRDKIWFAAIHAMPFTSKACKKTILKLRSAPPPPPPPPRPPEAVIPTLSEWGMIALTLIRGCTAVLFMRKKRKS